jgi:YfiH family protein
MHRPPFIVFPVFKYYSDLVCAFSIRDGGVSNAPFKSLNLGLHTGDDPENVYENRKIFFAALNVDPEQVAYADQVHSTHAEIVKTASLHKRTDALIYTGRDLYLTIQTADCFPVFIFIPRSETVAVIHAGWRGVVAGIIENTLTKLKVHCNVKPVDFIVAIGPGMQVECFEVKKDVYGRIPDHFLTPHSSPEHKYLNLRALILEKLLLQGIINKHIYSSDLCTKCESQLFYSYRRDGQNSGRMMGIIGIRK